MGSLSPKQTREVNAVLSADVQLPPPALLAKVPEQHGADDVSKRALERTAVLEKENNSLRQDNISLLQKLHASQNKSKARGQKLTAARKEKKLLVLKFDASQKENKSLRQEWDASRKSLEQRFSVSQNENKELGQKLRAAQEENKSLGQKLRAAQEENKSLGQKELDMRQLFNDFRQDGNGRKLDIDLWEKARVKLPKYFMDPCFDFHGKTIYTFSGIVIQLATKKNLLKEKKDLNLSSNRSMIDHIDIRLADLKKVANSFKKPEMKWDGSLCEGFYSWCLLLADVNKACHRDMTKELLDDMGKRAARGEYRYGEADLGPAVQAVIRQMRQKKQTQKPSSSSLCFQWQQARENF